MKGRKTQKQWLVPGPTPTEKITLSVINRANSIRDKQGSLIGICNPDDRQELLGRGIVKEHKHHLLAIATPDDVILFLRSRRGGSKTTVPLKSTGREQHVHLALKPMFEEENVAKARKPRGDERK